MHAIEMHRLTYTYPLSTTSAVTDLSLQIEAGQLVVIQGPTGCGKSTLLKCITGSCPQFYGGTLVGGVRVLGQAMDEVTDAVRAKTVGYVHQHPEAQFVYQSVSGEVAFSLENIGVPTEQMSWRIAEVLEAVGLSPQSLMPIHRLSGGQRQRLALAAALVHQPQVLVLDEPTSQLDPVAAEEWLDLLVRLQSEFGFTVVMTEHRVDRLYASANRVLYMEAGQLVTDGPPAQVAAWLRNHRTAQAPVLARLFPDATTPMLRVSEIRHYVNQHVLTEPATMTTATEVRGKDPLLRIRGLTVSYAEHRKRTDEEILALDNCDMEVLPGEVMAIVGPNGSGKSTLLGVLAGLVKITSGKVSGPLVTRNVKKGRLQLNSPFGYLPQNTDELLSQETVAEELQFGYTLAHGSMSATAVEQTLVDFGLTEFRARNPRELSGGQRTLVGLASLVVAKPKLLLLDEPTRGFDMVHKEHLGGLLQDKAANGIPTLLVTHDMEFAATYASQLLFLHQGRVVLKGSPKTVFRQAMMFAPLVARALRVAAPDVVCLADAVERGWAT